MVSLFAEPPNYINRTDQLAKNFHPSAGWLPPLDPFANLVADQRSGVLRRGHADEAAAIIEVVTGEVGGSPSPMMSPSRGEVEGMPDRTLGNPSTTTLGAITLLAFLNLLGYIQNVLTSSGRKRRSATFPPADLATLSEESPADGSRVPSRASVGFEAPFSALLQDFIDYIRRGDIEESTDRQDRLFFPWSQYSSRRTMPPPHSKTPVLYRRTSLPSSKISRPLQRTSQSSRGGIGSFISSVRQRLKLAASVMGFLHNPSPGRVRRALEPAAARAARHKRFTATMNAWYDDLAGQNYDGTRHVSPGGGGGLFNRLMVGLGRRILGV